MWVVGRWMARLIIRGDAALLFVGGAVGGEPVLGAVYNFFHDELFTGVAGRGAWSKREPIRVSGVRSLARASMATGFPHHHDYGDESLRSFIGQVQGSKKIRMLGSAALMGAYVACGWLDADVEEVVWLWDIAGAAAIVRAAGIVRASGKAGVGLRDVCAASAELSDIWRRKNECCFLLKIEKIHTLVTVDDEYRVLHDVDVLVEGIKFRRWGRTCRRRRTRGFSTGAGAWRIRGL